MSAYHGKEGSVSWINATTVDRVTNWTLTTTADVAEYTSMDDSTNKVYVAGFLDWSATVETVIDTDGLYPALDGTGIEDLDGASLILHGGTTSSARKYTGTAICTGLTTTLDLNDVIHVTYNFIGNGTLSEGADA